ncbi:MAG TPA: helix-turn-helix transcriptional regulator [Solirubrobacteraceae bacterium]|nr:helix-turn-helix transcriptional regulator [Solirubrobacteraceae bacterium]
MAQRSQAHAALGRAIRDFRGRCQISQEDLAHRAGMHRTYLGGIERGERNPSYTNLLKVADALEIDAWQLIRRASELDP